MCRGRPPRGKQSAIGRAGNPRGSRRRACGGLGGRGCGPDRFGLRCGMGRHLRVGAVVLLGFGRDQIEIGVSRGFADPEPERLATPTRRPSGLRRRNDGPLLRLGLREEVSWHEVQRHSERRPRKIRPPLPDSPKRIHATAPTRTSTSRRRRHSCRPSPPTEIPRRRFVSLRTDRRSGSRVSMASQRHRSTFRRCRHCWPQQAVSPSERSYTTRRRSIRCRFRSLTNWRRPPRSRVNLQ